MQHSLTCGEDTETQPLTRTWASQHTRSRWCNVLWGNCQDDHRNRCLAVYAGRYSQTDPTDVFRYTKLHFHLYRHIWNCHQNGK